MPPAINLTAAYYKAVAFSALNNKFCSCCHSRKVRGVQVFCKSCLAKLPAEMLENLRDREGFPKAYHVALAFLEGSE